MGGAGACTTSFGAGNKVLFAFLNGSTNGWVPVTDEDSAKAGVMGTLIANTTDGHTCPGAMDLQVPFSAYGQEAVEAQHLFSPVMSWAGYTKLHLWVKLTTTDYASLVGLDAYVQAAHDISYAGTYVDLGASPFRDGAYHELVVDLTQIVPKGNLSSVNKLAIQISTQLAKPGDAGAAPPPVTVSIDDIWLEAASI